MTGSKLLTFCKEATALQTEGQPLPNSRTLFTTSTGPLADQGYVIRDTANSK